MKMQVKKKKSGTKTSPDRTTRSLTVKPFAAKSDFKWFMSPKGEGKFAKASEAIDTHPSLRPVGTSQYGPLI